MKVRPTRRQIYFRQCPLTSIGPALHPIHSSIPRWIWARHQRTCPSPIMPRMKKFLLTRCCGRWVWGAGIGEEYFLFLPGTQPTALSDESTQSLADLSPTRPYIKVCQTRQSLQDHAIAAVHLKEGLHDHFNGKFQARHEFGCLLLKYVLQIPHHQLLKHARLFLARIDRPQAGAKADSTR